jgi:hypothetical protein
MGTTWARSNLNAFQAGARRKIPNILFLLADDWSYPHAGALWDKVVKTPAFNRIAADEFLHPVAYQPFRAYRLIPALHFTVLQ